MNNGQLYKAEGKAMLPPHPEDMKPGFDCCMQPPCVLKPPCQSNSPSKPAELRFQEIPQSSSNPNEVSNPNVFRDQFNNSPEEIQSEYKNYLKSISNSLQQENTQNPIYNYFYSNAQNSGSSDMKGNREQIELGAAPKNKNNFEGANSETLQMLGINNRENANFEEKKKEENSNGNGSSNNEKKESNDKGNDMMSQIKDLRFDDGNNVLFIPPPLMYQSQQLIVSPSSFLETSETSSLSSSKQFPLNRNSQTIDSFSFRQLNPDGVFDYDPNTGRRGRRSADLPDPEWDCLDKNISDLLHFICEQEVAMTFTKYCQPLIEQREVLIESFLYHDTTVQACQNMNMCPFTD